MKKYSIILIVVLCFNVTVKSQNSCGLYASISDYEQGVISIPANSKFGEKAIQVSDFFLRPYIYLKTDSTKQKISINSVYAFKCANGNIFRIWKGVDYQLIDTGAIKIYCRQEIDKVRYWQSRCYRYKDVKVTRFYFSSNDNSPILLLTLNNLKYTLRLNPEIEVLLCTNFTTDKSLQQKNKEKFAINEFLSKHIH